MEAKIKELLDKAHHIVVIQADNPDGDSLSSALALEHILEDAGKKVSLFCGVDMPSYLRYLSGWDRVNSELPTNFDLSIIVDTASISLLETLEKTGKLSWVSSKPNIIIDHHRTPSTIHFATLHYAKEAVSTTEVIYGLATELSLAINKDASIFLASGILSDSLGLTSESVTPNSVHALADLIAKGANLSKLDNERKKLQKKSPEILKYKGQLLERIEYSPSGKVAYLSIPWPEIEKYSHQYNPSILVIDEMRQVEGVDMAIAFKLYPDGRITGKIRANYGVRIANKLAEQFGGGGHEYASGFRVTDGRSYEVVKNQVLEKAEELLNEAV